MRTAFNTDDRPPTQTLVDVRRLLSTVFDAVRSVFHYKIAPPKKSRLVVGASAWEWVVS